MRYLFDIETNGLYWDATCIHVLAMLDLDTGEVQVYNDQGGGHSITTGLTFLDGADLVVGHNIIGFDIPVIRKLYPFFDRTDGILDTLVLSHLRYADIMDSDARSRRSRLPKTLWGSHSLAAWGHRLGTYKDDKPESWDKWTQRMQDYCIQDLQVNYKLWQLFLRNYPGLDLK